MRRKVALTLLVAVGLAAAASACPVCFGDTDSQMAAGTNNAIVFLLAIVVVVQAGFVALFVSFRRRARRLRRRRAQFQLFEGGAR